MRTTFSKFYTKSRAERLNILENGGFISPTSKDLLTTAPLLTDEVANSLIENQISQFPLPMGVALNFIVNGKAVIVPMVVEEPSVIAACSNGAKLISKQGGFLTEAKERTLIGQIIFHQLTDPIAAKDLIDSRQAEIFTLAQQSHPSIAKRGGGLKAIESRVIYNEYEQPEFLTIHLLVDVKDAMGANIVNTLLEGVSPLLEEWLSSECLMSILSNYNDHSLVTATCLIDPADLTTPTLSGLQLAQKIVTATRYADLDPYRAATHNKGIMNGIDSVLLATGNDTRAIEAGAHAYASRSGRYQSMSTWVLNADGLLAGQLTLPMPVGSVGGAISVLPLAKVSQELLQVESATELSQIIVAVGLAQNFSALKALVSEGIQKGHMGLHLKSLAIHAGALADEINALATLLKAEQQPNLAKATELLANIRGQA